MTGRDVGWFCSPGFAGVVDTVGSALATGSAAAGLTVPASANAPTPSQSFGLKVMVSSNVGAGLEGREADVQASTQDREVVLMPPARKGQVVGEDRRAGVGDAHNLRTQAATDVAVLLPIKV